jgi:hypothetical protein
MVSAESFMKVLFFTYDFVCSYEHDRVHVVACEGSLNTYNLIGDYIFHLTHYMFEAGCPPYNLDQFNSSSNTLQPRT